MKRTTLEYLYSIKHYCQLTRKFFMYLFNILHLILSWRVGYKIFFAQGSRCLSCVIGQSGITAAFHCLYTCTLHVKYIRPLQTAGDRAENQRYVNLVSCCWLNSRSQQFFYVTTSKWFIVVQQEKSICVMKACSFSGSTLMSPQSSLIYHRSFQSFHIEVSPRVLGIFNFLCPVAHAGIFFNLALGTGVPK